MSGRTWLIAGMVLALSSLQGPAQAQAQAAAASQRHGTFQRIKVPGPSLVGGLLGDSPDREVSIYLPPSYAAQPGRRYPVIYLLHGFNTNDLRWYNGESVAMDVPRAMDSAIGAGQSAEFIVVTPNAYTTLYGSFYSNSVVNGDWENYITRDLVGYIDGHFRTIARRESRGLAGHSMGGYGALRIGMRYPQYFSSLYLMSPCCLGGDDAVPTEAETSRAAEAVTTLQQFRDAPFAVKAAIASAAAWAPNPAKPPFFADLPVQGGKPQTEVVARMNAKRLLTMIDQYILRLKTYRAIGFDAGDEDVAIARSIGVLDTILTTYGVAHDYEIYKGDHSNRVKARTEAKLLPFFTRSLSTTPPRR